MKNYKNILLLRSDRIGDVILTTPAIKALRKTYPHARMTLLVSPATRDLVKGNPDLNEVIVDDRMKTHEGFWGFIKLICALKSRKFDLSINFIPKKRTNLLCFLSGIPNRIGYHNNKFGFLLTQKIPDDRPKGVKHEAQYCLDLLKTLDVNGSRDEIFIPVQEEAAVWARQCLKENHLDTSQLLIAVHPGASCPTKKWPVKRFVELMNKLHEQYSASLVMIGHEDNRGTADEILELLKFPVLDLTGKTTVAQLAGFLKECHLLISNDSGPVHIADALRVPVVSIFTRNQPGINPQRWGPLGEKSRIVAPPIQEGISFAKGEISDPKYLEQIQAQEVLEAVDAIFKLC